MINISISGNVLAGPSWEALETLIRSMVGAGKITRIARRDGQANYRDTSGVYDVTFSSLCRDESDIPVVVTLNEREGG